MSALNEGGDHFSTVWEAYKVTCRGWLISIASNQKKVTTDKIRKLTEELSQLDTAHKAKPKDDRIDESETRSQIIIKQEDRV